MRRRPELHTDIGNEYGIPAADCEESRLCIHAIAAAIPIVKAFARTKLAKEAPRRAIVDDNTPLSMQFKLEYVLPFCEKVDTIARSRYQRQ